MDSFDWTLPVAAILFIVYCSSESLANIARHAGAITNKFPIGLMISNQIYSINRLNGFLIGPLLGLYVDAGGGFRALQLSAFGACLCSAILLLIVLIKWPKLLRSLIVVVSQISQYGFSLKIISVVMAKKTAQPQEFADKRRDSLILLFQGIATAMSMPTVFMLNMLAIKFPEYQASLIQCATVISGVGNLLLNFYIFPRMALEETHGSSDYIYYSVMLGKICGIGLMAPCLILVL